MFCIRCRVFNLYIVDNTVSVWGFGKKEDAKKFETHLGAERFKLLNEIYGLEIVDANSKED